MEGVLHGNIKGTGVPQNVAKEFVDKTPANKRRAFAKSLAKRRKEK